MPFVKLILNKKINSLLIFLLVVISSFSSCNDHTLRKIEKISENSYKLITNNGTTFNVYENDSSLSMKTISITKLGNQLPLVNAIFDPIEQILLADSDDNDEDEIYIVTRSSGSGSYAELIAIAKCNNFYQQVPVVLPGTKDSTIVDGYQGHDQIWIENEKMFWQFPLYKEDDSNYQPTGGTQIIRYQFFQSKEQCIVKPFIPSP